MTKNKAESGTVPELATEAINWPFACNDSNNPLF